jgi:hypothetical protein
LQARDYGAASAKQSKQQTELFRSEFDGLGSAPDAAGGSIHLDISETMDFMRVMGGWERWLRAPEERFDACEKFEEAERLGDVVVGTHPQAADLIEFFAFGGEQENRRRTVFLAQRFQDAETIELGQHDIENSQVGLDVRKRLQAGNAVMRDFHVVALNLKVISKAVGEVTIIFDEKDTDHKVALGPD